MPFKQVTEQDLVGKGVIGQPAVPGLSVTEMQKSVEQVVREVAIPAHNQLCEQLQAQTAAEDIGAVPPGEEDLPAETPAKLQNVLQAMMAWAKEKLGLKADKADTYTKQQVEQAISNRVVAIGAGDMAMAVYDPESKKKPYLPADEGMAKAVYDADGDGMVDTARTAQTLAGQAAQAFLTKAVYDTDDDGVVDKAAAMQAYAPGELGELSGDSASFEGPVRMAVDEATGAVALHAVRQGQNAEGAPEGTPAVVEVAVTKALKAEDSDKIGGKALSMELSGTTLTINYG